MGWQKIPEAFAAAPCVRQALPLWDAAEVDDRGLKVSAPCHQETVSHRLEHDENEVARHLSVNSVSPPAVTMIPFEQRARMSIPTRPNLYFLMLSVCFSLVVWVNSFSGWLSQHLILFERYFIYYILALGFFFLALFWKVLSQCCCCYENVVYRVYHPVHF